MMATPLQRVKERFGDKPKLVAAVKKLAGEDLFLDRVNDVKGLERVSNAKLLRLHAVLETAKKDFGTRAKLVDAIATLEKRAKDDGYKARLGAYPVARLLDLHGAAVRRAKRATPAKRPTSKRKRPRSKKAQAKAKGG